MKIYLCNKSVRELQKQKDYRSLFAAEDKVSYMVNRKMKQFFLKDIIYMETCGHGTMVHTIHGSYRTNCSLTRAIQALTDQTDFIPCGKSYFVHLKYIEDVTKQRIVVKGGEYIFIHLIWFSLHSKNILRTIVSRTGCFYFQFFRHRDYFIKINGGLKE